MASAKSSNVKKTLLLDPHKLDELRDLFQVSSESEAVRKAIDEALAYRNALKLARRIQARGKFGRL